MPGAPDSQPPRRILLIKPSSLGDIVHALPVLAALRDAFPSAYIAWLVSSGFVSLLTGHPLLNEVIPFDRRRFGRMLQSPRILLDFLSFLRGLRRRRFDLVIDLQGLVRSGFMAWASGARRRVGFADARELAWLFYTRRIRVPPQKLHAVDRNVSILTALDLETAAPNFPLALGLEEEAAARMRLHDAAQGADVSRYIAVLPGARWESKLWPVAHWAALLSELHAAGAPPAVLLGAADDRARADAIRAACTAPLIDLVGRTSLRELTALLAAAERVICQDSGPMHLAAALGRPLVAIFGPTDARRTGPYAQHVRVVTAPIECAPCQRRRCPLKHHGCLARLTAAEVRAAFDSLPGAR
jgi:lipopolysaccharide heptosyltransferase I